MKNLSAYVDAIDLGVDDSPVCNLCGEVYDCPEECARTPLCHDCAQEAVAYLPRLLNLARMAMIPERDATDRYDDWHERLLKVARAAVIPPAAPRPVRAEPPPPASSPATGS